MIILSGTIFTRKMDKWTFDNDRERTQGSVVFKRQTEKERREEVKWEGAKRRAVSHKPQEEREV